jgi:O-antigen ligase
MNKSSLTEYSTEQVISQGRLFLVSLWILSLTISFDFISELKLFDLIAFIGIFVFRRQISPKNWLSGSYISKWSGLYLLIVFWGVLVTLVSSKELSWMLVVSLRFYRFFGYICLFLIISKLNLNREQLFKLFNIVFLAALIQAMLIILQKFGIVPTQNPGFYRGTLDHNHVNSITFMTVGIAAALGKLYHISFKRLMRAILILLSAVSMAFAMVLGQARGAFVALGILMVCQVRKIKGIIIVIVAVLGLLTVQMVTDYNFFEVGKTIFEDRLLRKMDTKRHYRSALDWDLEVIDKGRPYIWKTTLQILRENPSYLIFGVGFQNFKSIRDTTSAHNNFLHILVELGLAGLIVFILWLQTLWKEIKKWKFVDQKLYVNLSIPGIACFLAIIAVACFNEPFYAHRNSPGFLGFFLSYFAIITHRGWLDREKRDASK